MCDLNLVLLCYRKRGVMKSPRWGYFRIITGTLVGGVLGFYCMHRAELKYKVVASNTPGFVYLLC